MDSIPDGYGAIVEHAQCRGAGELLVEARQQGPDAIDNLDCIGLGLAVDAEKDRAGTVVPACGLVVLDGVSHHGNVAEAHRPVVARRHDNVAELVGVGQLRLGLDRQRLLQIAQRSDRRVGVGRGDRLLDLVHTNATGSERIGIELDTDGILLAAENLHLGNAVDGRKGRRDHLLRECVHVGQRRNIAAERQNENWRVRRVYLAVARRLRHLVRKLSLDARYRRLDVSRCSVNVPAETELNGNRGRALSARRADRVDAGNSRELLDKWRRNSVCHRVRRGTRQRSRDIDGGELGVATDISVVATGCRMQNSEMFILQARRQRHSSAAGPHPPRAFCRHEVPLRPARRRSGASGPQG